MQDSKTWIKIQAERKQKSNTNDFLGPDSFPWLQLLIIALSKKNKRRKKIKDDVEKKTFLFSSLCQCILTPFLQLHTLQAVHIRVSEKDCSPTRHWTSVLDTCILQTILQWGNVFHANAEVTISAAVGGAAILRVGIRQLHEMNHFRTDPEPGSSVRKFLVRAVGIHLQTQSATVEIKGALQILAEDSDVMDSMEEDAAWRSRWCRIEILLFINSKIRKEMSRDLTYLWWRCWRSSWGCKGCSQTWEIYLVPRRSLKLHLQLWEQRYDELRGAQMFCIGMRQRWAHWNGTTTYAHEAGTHLPFENAILGWCTAWTAVFIGQTDPRTRINVKYF